jgi:hypothetical protein
MNVDLCEGVPGEPGLVTAGLSACIRAISAATSAAVGVAAPLLPERSVASVAVLDVVGRPLLLPSPVDEAPVLVAFSLPFLDLASGCILSSLRVCMGISATPIITEVAVPIRAPAAPETGSQGPSSGTYSRGRYLHLLVCGKVGACDCLQFHVREVHFALLSQHSSSFGTQLHVSTFEPPDSWFLWHDGTSQIVVIEHLME